MLPAAAAGALGVLLALDPESDEPLELVELLLLLEDGLLELLLPSFLVEL
ncbi:MAG TPA: hypothetical protein VEZ71_16675 [Archangium sp.]|nr:hypothetical protein [Archangium sp.]